MLLTLTLILLLQTTITIDAETYLQQGLNAEQQGKYEQALQIWAGAMDTLDKPSPAIGRQYIRLVTQHKIRDYYEEASKIYFWGFSADGFKDNRKVLQTEFEFLEPLLESEEKKRWKGLLENRDSSLFAQIRLFWKQVDPTPASEYNERLIEHWERIAYARENFTRSSDDSPYGTDERGIAYIQYGKPDELHTGRLHLSTAKIVSTVKSILETSSSSTVERAMASAIMGQMYNYPEYEIWVYYNPNSKMRYELVLIFGETKYGGFNKATTVEDFIPNRAFSLSNRYSYVNLSGGSSSDGGINPAIIMQWLYYEQLSNISGYFADSYASLVHTLLTESRISQISPKIHAGNFKQKHFHLMRQNLNAAPQQESTYEKTFPEIQLAVQQYRLLDTANRPVYATILESHPMDAFLTDFAINQDTMMPGTPDFENTTAVNEAFAHYELLHGVQLHGPDYQKLGGQQLPARLIIDGKDAATPSGSAFIVPYAGPAATQVFYAELRNHHPNTIPPDSTPFPQELRGLGKAKLKQPDPLNTNPDQLEMGDLVLGYQPADEDDTGSLFPFVVSTDRTVPEGEELMVHAEIYHLEQGSDGIARFKLHYEIKPKNFLGWTKEKADKVSLTLNLETDQSRWTENLQIRSRSLEPGKYVLRIRADDSQSGQQVYREVHFEVTEHTQSPLNNG